jgi:glucokinase
MAIFAHDGQGNFSPLRHRTIRSKRISSYPRFLRNFLVRETKGLAPPVTKACIGFAGPVGPERSEAMLTNLQWGFSSQDIRRATGIDQVTLMNDFEAVGYGLEVLMASQPGSFVPLSQRKKLPPLRGKKQTAVVIGAGTGLGTTILIGDSSSGNYRPIAGEGGHTDFIAIDEDEFYIAQWLRKHRNRSAKNPIDLESVVSGPGLANVYSALGELDPLLGDRSFMRRVARAEPYDRPAIIFQNADKDSLCRRTVDTWLRCYARTAKNYAIFPLAPAGVFLAGGVAAKVLPEMQSGLFMKEFTRCDIPNMRKILKRTPVFVITDYRIGLYGCANVAANPDLLF